MKTAVVGCGWGADLYMQSLPNHANLEIVGAFDVDRQRLLRFTHFHRIDAYSSFDALLDDSRVELVLNLTNPASHFEVSKACLEADKHVYTEKPMALELEESARLVAMARQRGLTIASAPCSLLGETAQALWQAVRDGRAGRAHLAYAELDDGPVYQMRFDKWVSASGAPWPARDELATGCAIEHAGYYLTWLAAIFGPAQTVTAFSSSQVADKLEGLCCEDSSPDFAVACIRFETGIVARLTTSTIAPRDHSLRVIGDRGVLSTSDCWSYASPVYFRRWRTIRRRTLLNPWRWRIRCNGDTSRLPKRRGAARMDWCRGPAEIAASIEFGRACRLPADFCLHINELELAISRAGSTAAPYRLTTGFEPLEPLFDFATRSAAKRNGR